MVTAINGAMISKILVENKASELVSKFLRQKKSQSRSKKIWSKKSLSICLVNFGLDISNSQIVNSQWLHLYDESEFSNVHSNCLGEQMHRHIGCIWIIFFLNEYLFSNQIAWLDNRKVKLLSFFRLFSRLSFQMYLQMAGVDRGIITLNDLTPELIFKCFLRLPHPTDAKSHWLYLNDFLLSESSNLSSKQLPKD